MVRSAWVGFWRQVARPRRRVSQPNEGRGVKARFAPHQPLRGRWVRVYKTLAGWGAGDSLKAVEIS